MQTRHAASSVAGQQAIEQRSAHCGIIRGALPQSPGLFGCQQKAANLIGEALRRAIRT
jgi:hypothetical protein